MIGWMLVDLRGKEFFRKLAKISRPSLACHLLPRQDIHLQSCPRPFHLSQSDFGCPFPSSHLKELYNASAYEEQALKIDGGEFQITDLLKRQGYFDVEFEAI